jgi:very-short-patch-repair endonuclease
MANEAHVWGVLRTKRAPRSVDEAIAALAARQHGVVSRAQLLDLGVGPDAIKHRVALGRLHPLHRGVYAVGHRALRSEAWWMAAVLAAGPGAALSYRSAAELWGIRSGSRPRIDVSVPRHRRSTARLEVHVVAMRPDEVTVEDGVRVTTPTRTLLDLAAVVSPQHLKAAFDEAEVRRLTSPTSLDALVARYPGRKGTRAISELLARHRAIGAAIPTSVLERRLLTVLDANGLPRPHINRRSDDGELDATWHEQRLIVECDGFATHGTREAFERDRAKDRALHVAGWRVVRVTWRQLRDDGDVIARQLAALLKLGPAAVRGARGARAGDEARGDQVALAAVPVGGGRAEGGGGGAGHNGILRSDACRGEGAAPRPDDPGP